MQFQMDSSDWQRRFSDKLAKKYDIYQQHADIEGRQQLAAEKVNEQRFGPGGLESQVLAMQKTLAGMQYGPGGQGDRNNLAHERNVALQFGKGSGYAEHNLANANQANTASELGQFQLGVGRDTRPELLAQNRATFGLNTATNQGELTAKLDENFKKETARTLAMPQYNDPYIKTVPEQPEGWFSKLWSGNLYNPLDPTVAAKRKRESMLKNKTDSLNENFLATNPSYR
jgi:hypothetical protein